MKEFAIIGHFGNGHICLNGQTIKTQNVYDALCKEIGSEQVLKVDSFGGLRFLIKLPIILMRTLKQAKHIIIMPAQNGVRVIPLLSVWVNKLFHRKIYYIVIGGWLPKMVQQKRLLRGTLKKLDEIFVETTTMQLELNQLKIDNVFIMPNFKNISIRDKEKVSSQHFHVPYPVCIFSRITRMKGIEDAVNVIKRINEQSTPAFKLDIYGAIDKGEENWFEELQKKFTPEITYKGFVKADGSPEILSQYMFLLFPTHYYTEGIPGTIIDAYSAGVPVIASMWQSYKDVIDEKETGYCYPFLDTDKFEQILTYIAKNPGNEDLKKMSLQCIKKARRYTPKSVIAEFLHNINYYEE